MPYVIDLLSVLLYPVIMFSSNSAHKLLSRESVSRVLMILVACFLLSCGPREEDVWLQTDDYISDLRKDPELKDTPQAHLKLTSESIPRDIISFNIPNTISKIDYETFISCRQLKEIILPKSLKVIFAGAFSHCDQLKTVINQSTHFILENGVVYDDEKKEVEYVFPSLVKGRLVIASSVINIRDRAFRDCTELCEVILPEGLKRIGDHAFSNCSQLQRINFPSTLRIIGTKAFKKCINLRDIQIEGNYYHFEDGILYRDKKRVIKRAFPHLISEHVDLPGSTRWIEPRAFENCKQLRYISMPMMLSKIGWGAFYSCENLESIDIPWRVKKIEDQTFYDCINLKSVELPSSRLRLEDGAFYNCKSLQEINLPDTIEFIVGDAFTGCSGLKKLRFPPHLTEVGSFTCYSCTQLEEVALPKDLKYLMNSSFEKCISLKNIHIPSAVTTIRRDAFKGCTQLREVVIESRIIETIEPDIFSNCPSLERIIIPKGTHELRTLIESAHPELSAKIIESE